MKRFPKESSMLTKNSLKIEDNLSIVIARKLTLFANEAISFCSNLVISHNSDLFIKNDN